MKSLIDRIIQDGHSLDGGILKVDRFINHQMDPYLKIKKMNVYEEASRCLLCQDAPCTTSPPCAGWKTVPMPIWSVLSKPASTTTGLSASRN